MHFLDGSLGACRASGDCRDSGCGQRMRQEASGQHWAGKAVANFFLD